MRLLTFTGQPGSALAYYSQYTQRLKKELGIQPDEKTRALADLIRSGSLALKPPVKPSIAEITPIKLGKCPYKGLALFREQDAPFFFGRDRYVQRLLQGLNEQPLVVVVVGLFRLRYICPCFARFTAYRPDTRQLVGGRLPARTESFFGLAFSFIPLMDPPKSETEHLIEAKN